MNEIHAEKNRTSRGADTRYLALVGGLLVLIVALLAVLWIRERTNRISAQEQVVSLLRDRKGMQAGMQQMMLAQKFMAVQPVNREDMITERGVLNGKTVTLVRISAAAGERFGFLPGDVVLVAPTGRTPPTSGPAAGRRLSLP